MINRLFEAIRGDHKDSVANLRLFAAGAIATGVAVGLLLIIF